MYRFKMPALWCGRSHVSFFMSPKWYRWISDPEIICFSEVKMVRIEALQDEMRLRLSYTDISVMKIFTVLGLLWLGSVKCHGYSLKHQTSSWNFEDSIHLAGMTLYGDMKNQRGEKIYSNFASKKTVEIGLRSAKIHYASAMCGFSLNDQSGFQCFASHAQA